MHKMRLDLEEVTVETFEVLPGGVMGHNGEFVGFGELVDGAAASVSCNGTCGKTCPSPCDTSPESCSCLRTCPCAADEEAEGQING